jgi:hypothetical protein
MSQKSKSDVKRLIKINNNNNNKIIKSKERYIYYIFIVLLFFKVDVTFKLYKNLIAIYLKFNCNIKSYINFYNCKIKSYICRWICATFTLVINNLRNLYLDLYIYVFYLFFIFG